MTLSPDHLRLLAGWERRRGRGTAALIVGGEAVWSHGPGVAGRGARGKDV